MPLAKLLPPWTKQRARRGNSEEKIKKNPLRKGTPRKNHGPLGENKTLRKPQRVEGWGTKGRTKKNREG